MTEPLGESLSQALSQNWMTLWRSELAAMAADRELGESLASLSALMAQAASAAALYMRAATTQPDHDPDQPNRPAGDTAPDEPAGPAPAAAAPDPRLDEIERLKQRVLALEQRLAADAPLAPAAGAAPRRRR